MPLGIDPTVDYVFKKLFGSQENSDLLVHLLNAILAPKWPIVAVEILNPFNAKDFEEDKLSILDVKALDANRAWFNVEMQTKAPELLRQRLPYYNATLLSSQLLSGDGYHELLPVISICILKQSLFPEVNVPHLNFKLRDCQHGVQFTDCVQIHTIELAKYNFPEQRAGALDSIRTAPPLEQWAYFLNNAARLEGTELQTLLPEAVYLKATGVMEMIAQTPEERMRYEARRLAELDFKSYVEFARIQALKEGRKEGLDKGLEEGREEGREEGLKLGLAGQIRVFQSLLHEPIASDADLLGMPLETLVQLSEELKSKLTLPE